MSIIIQSITVVWRKEQRGGSGAAERNSIPEAFELPLDVCVYSKDNPIVIHEVRLRYYDNFKPMESSNHTQGSRVRIKGGVIDITTDLLQVYFSYSEYDCGKPYRSKYDETGSLVPIKEKAFDLFDNQYGRIAFNGRYTCYDTGNWWYEKKVHNIIHTDEVNKDIFVKNQVDKKYSQLAVLK